MRAIHIAADMVAGSIALAKVQDAAGPFARPDATLKDVQTRFGIPEVSGLIALPDHSSLPDFQVSWTQMAVGVAKISPEGLIAFVTGMEPEFEADTGWAHGDTRCILLGLVAAEGNVRPWHEEVVT